MDAVLRSLSKEQNNMLAMLRRFVESESPSTAKTAVDRFSAMVGGAARALHGRVQWFESQQTGKHLRAEFRCHSRRAAGQILLLGHLDTVWEVGTLRRMPFRIRQGRAYGPGVFDMKAGIVMGLFAVQALQERKIPVRKKLVFLLTADEEIGSGSSRRIIEREARRSDFVLVLEPAHGPQGALKTARKGVGDFLIHVQGRPAHAGLEPEKGSSAVVELCRQILRLEKLADRRRGITLNAGVISGGTRANVVPAEAVAHLDARVLRRQDMNELERKIRSLKPFDPRTRMEIQGGFNRPPLERTPQGASLFERARSIADSLGMRLQEAAVGGGSDGNFTAALGVPTLDGLGAVGEGAHAPDENIIITELPRRAALLAGLIADLGG